MKFVEIVKDGLAMEKGSPWEKNLKAGKRYLVSDLIHQQLNYMKPDHISRNVIDLKEVYRPYKGEDLNGKTLLVWRHGGIGDLLFMMPPLRILKATYPDCKILVGVGGKYIDLYKRIPYVDEIHQLPFDIETLDIADYHLHFEQIIEGNPRAETTNAYDLFLEKFGFKPEEVDAAEKVPDVFLTDQEIKDAQKRMDEFGIKEEDILIGIQIAASSPIRTFPSEKIVKVCHEIIKEEKVKIILFGSLAQIEAGMNIKLSLPVEYQNKILISAEQRFTLRDSMAVTRHCDLIVAPDSAMIHIAGALRVPVIGLYGPFPADLRMRYYYNALALNASPACAPCFIHDHDPCPKGSPSPCFSVIDEQQVLFAIEYMLNKTVNKSIGSINALKKNVFTKVLDKATPYMKGKGIDVGSGYQKYGEGFDIIRIDVNPMVNPDIIANFYAPNFEIDEKIDYIISSYSINNTKDLSLFMTKADSFLEVGGHIILYIGNQTFIKEIDRQPPKYLLDYFRSSFTPESLDKAMALCDNYRKIESVVAENEDGIFQIWRKESEAEPKDGHQKTFEELGITPREVEKP